MLTMTEAELDANPKPYLVTRCWAKEMYDKVNGDMTHWEWQSRVLGEFPQQSSWAMYPIALVHQVSDPIIDTGGAVNVGIDVAGQGRDETVVAIRERGNLIGIWAFPDADPRGKVVQLLGRFDRRLESVNVDAIGLGYNFALHLKDLGFPVRMVNVADAATHPDQDEIRAGLRQPEGRNLLALPHRAGSTTGEWTR